MKNLDLIGYKLYIKSLIPKQKKTKKKTVMLIVKVESPFLYS